MQTNLTEFEKQIYNEHLIAQRTANNKPFSVRKDFTDLDDSKVLAVKKAAMFFSKFKHIKTKDFFIAPYKVYGGTYFDLSFYLTSKAILAHKLYIFEQLQSADQEWVLDKIRQSWLFIYKFCKDNQMNPEQYIHAKTGADVPWFAIHLQQFDICLYVLFAFDFIDTILNINEQNIEFILGKDFKSEVKSFRIKFYASSKCKNLVREGLRKITEKLNNK